MVCCDTVGKVFYEPVEEEKAYSRDKPVTARPQTIISGADEPDELGAA